MVCMFIRVKLLKWQENVFGWLILDMIKVDDYCAIFMNLKKMNKNASLKV